MKADFQLSGAGFPEPRVDADRRSDGSLVLRSPIALRSYARCVAQYVERWAAERPDRPFLAQREGDTWRTVSWGEALGQVRCLGSYLLSLNLSVSRPLVILSDNSIEHGLLTLASMYVGIPIAPISPAYSLLSRDFIKLKKVFKLLDPGMVFADDAAKFAAALSAVPGEFEFVFRRNGEGVSERATPFAALLEHSNDLTVDQAFSSQGPQSVVKLLFTSGSTGEPKAVINTNQMLCSNMEARAQLWPFLDDEPPVLVDWLPWSHTFGGNHNLGLVLRHGGTLFIDEGKPAPGLVETTLRNLREISPNIYFNVPRGFDMLVSSLESDERLRRTFFARMKMIMYAAAALPKAIWERLEALMDREIGRRVPLTASWGSTETSPQATLVYYAPLHSSVIGLPIPGCEVKMVPVPGTANYELRTRGPNVTPGYWKREDLTREAFDEEGFYHMGDCGRFIDPNNLSAGIAFVGRLAEDFKLSTGTWVHVGALRVRAVAAMSPVVQDVVVVGDGRDDIRLLLFSNGAVTGAAREKVRLGLQSMHSEGNGSSTFATAAIFLTEPPSIDHGEITDKGYINQRAVIARRADMVDRLYADDPNIIWLPSANPSLRLR